MPTPKTQPAPKKLVPIAAEPSTVTQTRRVRLSKALATKPVAQPKGGGTKSGKPKSRSNRYKLPDTEYAQLTALKQRLLALGTDIRKSELLRAGLMLLVAMNDLQLQKAVAKVELLMVGPRPGKIGAGQQAQ